MFLEAPETLWIIVFAAFFSAERAFIAVAAWSDCPEKRVDEALKKPRFGDGRIVSTIVSSPSALGASE